MKAAIYLPTNNAFHQNILAAFGTGLQKHGIEIEVIELETFNGEVVADFAIVYGVGKIALPYSRYRQAVRNVYHRAGHRVMVLERGYVRRDAYHAAGWDGLNNRADFMNSDMPPERFWALDVELKPYELPKDGYILLIGQVPWDASVQYLDHGGWLQTTFALAVRHTNREFRFRPHPLAGDAIKEVRGTTISDEPLDEAIAGAWGVITQNSNVGVDASIAGRPVWASDIGSMVYRIANLGLSNIEQPNFCERNPWANDLAYAQWTVEEMVAGVAWEHLRHGLSMPIHLVQEASGAPGGLNLVGSAPFSWSEDEQNNRTH